MPKALTLQEASNIAYAMDVLHSNLINELRVIQGRLPLGDFGAPVFDSLQQVLDYTRTRGKQITELRDRIAATYVLDVSAAIQTLGNTFCDVPKANKVAEITAVEFFKQMQDKIKATDVGEVDTIVGVAFYANGEPSVRYSLGAIAQRTRTIPELIAFCLEGSEL